MTSMHTTPPLPGQQHLLFFPPNSFVVYVSHNFNAPSFISFGGQSLILTQIKALRLSAVTHPYQIPTIYFFATTATKNSLKKQQI
jgi:hypothetical protein